MKALILLIVSGILAAGVFIAGKQARIEELSPLMILFWQMSGGALVVWIVSLPSRRFPSWNWIHLRYYLVGGLLGISLPYVLAFIIMRELQVGLIGLVTALSPVATYAMARLSGLEPGHPLRFSGLILGLAGVGLLVMPEETAPLSGEWLPMILALGIPLSLAASNIYRSRFWPTGSEAIPLVIGMLSVQSAWLFIVNLFMGNFHEAIPDIQNTGVLLIALGLMAGASYLSSFNLLKIGGPVYLSQMGYVITATTLLAGMVLWDEHYDVNDFLSMGLIFSGVLLTTLTQKAQSSRRPFPATTRN